MSRYSRTERQKASEFVAAVKVEMAEIRRREAARAALGINCKCARCLTILDTYQPSAPASNGSWL